MRGSPGADFLGTTTIGLAHGLNALSDNTSTFQCFNFLLYPIVVFEG